MERLHRIARRRPWYKEARRTHLKRVIVVVIAMLGVAAIPFYQMLTSIAPNDQFPAKTTTELLDALEARMKKTER